MKIVQRVQKIWSRYESVTDGMTYSSASMQGITQGTYYSPWSVICVRAFFTPKFLKKGRCHMCKDPLVFAYIPSLHSLQLRM